MNNRTLNWTPLRVWVVFGLVILLGFIFFAARASASNGQQPAINERLVTIYDQGTERTIITKADTVKEALTQAHVTLEASDAVEPAASEQLVAKSYRVNVYRARPVLIIDGEKRQSVMTAEQSPRRIVESIPGQKLYDEDKVSFEQVNSVIAEGGAGLKLRIDRATVFQFTLYGKTFEARTQAKTVGDMLKEKSVQLSAVDGSSAPMNAPLVAGMNVSVWRNGKQTLTQEEAIAMPVEEVKDTALEIGYRAIKTPGADGKKQVTYELDMRDGKEISRTIITSVTTLQPVTQQVTVGAKVALSRNYSADKISIMAAAGISENEYGAAAYIIDHENGMWCPTRWQGQGSCPAIYVEKFSGAESSAQVGYGLCQSTPAIKMASAGDDWRTNPVTQMRWCTGYAISRYGSWTNAYQHWLVAHSW